MLLSAVVAIGTALYLSQREHADERYEAANYDLQSVDESTRADCAAKAFPESLVCIGNALETDREDRERQYDLKAQQDVEDWAQVTALATIVGLMVSGVGLWALLRTLEATREANERIAESARREQRAYLVVVAVVAKSFAAREATQFVIEYENRGSTPARDIRSWGYSVLVDGPEENFKLRPPGKIRLGANRTVLGPGLGAHFPLDGVRKLTKDEIADIASRKKSYIVAAVIRYRDVFGKRHWTMIKAVLQEKPSADKEAVLSFCDRGNYST